MLSEFFGFGGRPGRIETAVSGSFSYQGGCGGRAPLNGSWLAVYAQWDAASGGTERDKDSAEQCGP
ncbi:MAG: hypothetical protein H6668_05185 [Ardenticatenaceae bacterium]|nr:hypothetical protein [Ardenticatenaceae bacterium]